jgi:putative nucleotidyltransferase with HDIG domain
MQTWTDILRASNPEILLWAAKTPWARAMAACQQDAQWHAEGDVWTHTKMVCAELERLPEWPAMERVEQLKLLFAGLFHDSGKPATTIVEPETGRTRSPKHALIGTEIARRILRELGCDLTTREEIVSLVRYHGRPPYLLEKEKPEREVISLSWLTSNRLLYLFALADTRGRDSTNSARPEENLHLWKLVADEHDCFEQPYKFANNHARFLFYREQLSSLHYTPHESYRCTVTLMSGLPGAGKDTWLARHCPKLPVVSLDAVRSELDVDATDNQGEVIQRAREQCREHLRAGLNFAFNATNTSRLTRQRWIDLFADYSARIEIVYIEPPLHTLFEQNKKRPSPVPEGVIKRLIEKLEPPTLAEAHAVTFAGGSG